jgi:hypothetical protein
VRGDVARERAEQFVVVLSAPVGAPVADGEGLGTIIDNDAPPASPKTPRLPFKVTPTKDAGAPFTFVSSGRLVLPRGLVKAKGCQGRVSIQVKAVRKTISTRRAAISRGCRFKKAVTFHDGERFAANGRLRFQARYLGTPFLKKAKAKTVTVGTK